MRDVWEVAKKMELEGKQHYTEMSKETNIPELAGVFKQLASEEQRHYEMFDALQKGARAPAAARSKAIAEAKKAFESIAEDVRDCSKVKSAEGAYQKAALMEQKSVEFYTKTLKKTTDSKEKIALSAIIAEEKGHVALMEGMVDFVRQPQEWLEDAEFNHLDEF
jgi:rubrerythrin